MNNQESLLKGEKLTKTDELTTQFNAIMDSIKSPILELRTELQTTLKEAEVRYEELEEMEAWDEPDDSPLLQEFNQLDDDLDRLDDLMDDIALLLTFFED